MSVRRSPIHHLLEPHHPEWRELDSAAIAWRMIVDDASIAELGICDLSPLRKLGLRGSGAAPWLADRRIVVPTKIYAAERLPDAGWILRTGANNFFLESGLSGETVSGLDAELGHGGDDLVRAEQQEAAILLTGRRVQELFAQTCAIDVHAAESEHVLMTRVAGVSAMVLPVSCDGERRYRIWCDPSYAIYLWQALVEILRELGGSPCGAEQAKF